MSWPWTGAAAGVRTAGEAAEELAQLRKLAAAETDLDGILLSTEDRLAKSHVAATAAEALQPAGTLVLNRVWRGVDEMMGPGRGVLHALTARYPALRTSFDRIHRYLTLSDSLISDASRKVVLSRMDAELKAFAQLRQQILDVSAAEAETLAKDLTATLGPEVKQSPKTLTASQLREECQRALGEAEQRLTQLRAAAGKSPQARVLGEAVAQRGREQFQALAAGRRAGRTAQQTSRVRAVARFGDPTIAEEFARRVKQRLGSSVPAVKGIPDTELFFAEALGVAASAKNRKLLIRWVEDRASLAVADLRRVEGYLSQLKGLLPEEVAVRMEFMQGVFAKRAFEALDAFPPELRGQMTVEMVNGPMWVDVGRGAKRQFGDGTLLLTGPGGQSTIIGLGEFKHGFDEDLIEQLFVRSDGRAVSSAVEFSAADGSTQTRMLTREFTFEGKAPLRIQEPPLYIYGRPAGESVESAAKFKSMVENEMASGRELWKVQLPFTMQMNSEFAEVALDEAVRVLRKKPRWGG